MESKFEELKNVLPNLKSVETLFLFRCRDKNTVVERIKKHYPDITVGMVDILQET